MIAGVARRRRRYVYKRGRAESPDNVEKTLAPRGHHDNQGIFQNLIREMELADQASFKNYFRMSLANFNSIAEKVDTADGYKFPQSRACQRETGRHTALFSYW